MAITILQRGPSSWRLRVEVEGPDGKRTFRYETVRGTREDAEERRAQLNAEVRRGKHIGPRETRTALEWARAWTDKREALGEIRPSTKHTIMERLTAAAPVLNRPFADIARTEIEAFYASERRRGLKSSTVRLYHQLFGSLFRAAEDAGILLKNPMRSVRIPAIAAGIRENKALTDAEATRLLDACRTSEIGFLVRFCLATGLRRGEVCALNWSDIDLEKGTAHVARTWSRTETGWAMGPPKTARSQRAVSIPRALLLECRMRRGEPHEPVFPNVVGGRRSPASVSIMVQVLFKQAGIEGKTLHGLRHTHATKLLQGRHNIKAIADRLGHSSPTITLAAYSHAMPGDDEILAEAANGFMTGYSTPLGSNVPNPTGLPK